MTYPRAPTTSLETIDPPPAIEPKTQPAEPVAAASRDSQLPAQPTRTILADEDHKDLADSPHAALHARLRSLRRESPQGR